MADNTVILGRPLKRKCATATRPAGVWHTIMRQDSTRISAEAWVHFIAVTGVEQTAPNVWSDGVHDYMFERRSDDRA